MNFSRSLNCILFLTTTLTITLFLTLQANAAAPFDTTMCNITNIVTGNAGKAFAAFAVISLGVGFFSGKISLGLLVASSIGISSIFAAPSMVSLLSGKDAYECEEGATYVTDCSVDGVCYSCPAGFTGPNCSDCNTGYSVGIDGVCKLDCTISPTIPGITDTTVQNGTGSLTCNADSNYIGSIDYSCDNNNFSITGGQCTCDGRHAGVGCTSCEAGYSGSECDECASHYSDLADGCVAECYVSNKLGISDQWVLPHNGTLTCSDTYNNISINYTCTKGVFNGDSCIKCSGGEESEISVSGVSYKVHEFSSVGGTPNFSCNGDKTVEVLVVAGGGSGGVGIGGGGGGGGAGGVVHNSSYSITSGNTYIVAVGNGGAGVTYLSHGNNGDNSSFGTIIAYGGGGGASQNGSPRNRRGLSGGSGGGNGRDSGSATGGTVTPVTPGSGGTTYGNAGGGSGAGWNGAGGGGGAGGVGVAGSGGNSSNEQGGNGGDGIPNSITGTELYYAGGGGGATQYSPKVGIGKSGGGNGSNQSGIVVTSGINKTGSGGGGSAGGTSGSGGSGIVIVRYVK